MSRDNQHTKTWPGMEWPLPDEEAITEAVGGWLGFYALQPGDEFAGSRCFYFDNTKGGRA